MLASWIDVGGRCDPYRPGASRAQIREDVAEQIGSDDHIEAVRIEHELRRQGINVIPIGTNVRKLRPDVLNTLVPIGHADVDAVRFCRRSQMLLAAAARKFEGIAHDAVDAEARHDRLLYDELAVGSLEGSSTQGGILTLGILSDDDKVDIAWAATRQRRP